MNEVLTQPCALAGSMIFAQADGSSGPELLRVISSRTVTWSPLVRRVTTSLLSLAWPRTLTLLASTTAGPATSGTVFNSAARSFFFEAGFFSDFFFAALVFLAGLAAGALVAALVAPRAAGGALVSASAAGGALREAVAGGGVATGAFVAVCA